MIEGQEVRELVVEAVLESFLMRTCSKKHNIAEVAIKGLAVELHMDSRATQVAITLGDISVRDLAADSLYRTVVWIDEKVTLFSMQVSARRESAKLLSLYLLPVSFCPACHLQ